MTSPYRGEDEWGHVPGNFGWQPPSLNESTENGSWMVNMTVTQNIRPRQQRSGSKRSILRSWSGLASLQTKISLKSVEGAEASSCQATASEPKRIWRGSAKRNEPKSLPRSVQTCWKTTTNIWPLCLPTKVSPPSPIVLWIKYLFHVKIW